MGPGQRTRAEDQGKAGCAAVAQSRLGSGSGYRTLVTAALVAQGCGRKGFQKAGEGRKRSE